MKKFLIAVIASLAFVSCRSTDSDTSTTSSLANQSQQDKVKQFFANYGIIGTKSFDDFKVEQRKLLAANMMTDVIIRSPKKTYSGPEGYFQSLGDWSAIFSTGSDFKTGIYAGPFSTVYARIHSTLSMTDSSGTVSTVPDSGHCWTETFVFDSNNKIQKLTVDMKLGVKCGKTP